MNKTPLHPEQKKWKAPKGPKNTQHKNKNTIGLGRTLKNMKNKAEQVYYLPDGEMRFTTEKHEDSWVKLRSVTQENALDEFLNTAALADTDFTAEKGSNVKIIKVNSQAVDTGNYNPYLLTSAEQNKQFKIQKEHENELTVPRRPIWNKTTTKYELERAESEAFLAWRRELAMLQENHDLLLTPFERNIMVWKQLWRVVERSDLVIQIVDARNPLLFRSIDLEKYVKELNPLKKNLLLVNKSDLLTFEQRLAWAKYFKKNDIKYTFFSALKANELLELQKQEEEALKGYSAPRPTTKPIPSSKKKKQEEDEESDFDSEEDYDTQDESDLIEAELEAELKAEAEAKSQAENEDDEDYEDYDSDDYEEYDSDDLEGLNEEEKAELQRLDRELEAIESKIGELSTEDDQEKEMLESTKIISVDELEELCLRVAPEPLTEPPAGQPKRLQIGLVGYPNVGKSSTINALVGSKKVSVSATPGKTKHFQTILLSDKVILCDCPGLVFPNFAYTNAELVCNGVLPIDQLREVTGPSQLVAKRIPKYFLEAVYGIMIPTTPIDEGGTGIPTSQELLNAYARARGYMTQGFGSADESRAARYVLKDYVKGKLLYVNPPPHEDGSQCTEEESQEFNKGLYTLQSLPDQRKEQLISAIKEKGLDVNGFDLSTDLNKVTFSSHISTDDSLNSNKHARTHGGKQAALINSAADLDQEFFRMNGVKGQFQSPFHKGSGGGGDVGGKKKHFKGNKRQAKKAFKDSAKPVY